MKPRTGTEKHGPQPMGKLERRGSVLDGLAAIAVVAAAVLALRRRGKDGATEAAPEPTVPVPVAPPPGPARSLLRRFDYWQRRNAWAAFPFGVVKKFSEDKAGYLAALVAYFGFFSIFPLMLAFTSVLGFILDDPEAQQEFSDAAADQIPVIGEIIRNTAGQLEGSEIAIVAGLLVALWSGLRIVDAMQNALNEVWDLPRTARPKLVERRLRGVAMLALIGGGLVASIAASNVASVVGAIPGAGRLSIWGASAFASVLLYLGAYQLLTDVRLPWKDLWPGAIFGGISWWALQTFGSVFIINQQQSAGATYGQFASIIALLVFLFIAAQFSILGAEINVVRARRLWPRSFTKGEFTPADISAFEYQAASMRQDDLYDIRIEPRAPVVDPPGDQAGG